jgi:hypothetical protein
MKCSFVVHGLALFLTAGIIPNMTQAQTAAVSSQPVPTLVGYQIGGLGANISILLDYSSRTNPPAIQLFWPQNGEQISGTNFAWRGWVDDPTATVSAQVVGADGATNTITGLVERNGNFWVENLPMANGTNSLTLTVTDSAGNTGTTNITVLLHFDEPA